MATLAESACAALRLPKSWPGSRPERNLLLIDSRVGVAHLYQKEFPMTELRRRMTEDMRLHGLAEGTPRRHDFRHSFR